MTEEKYEHSEDPELERQIEILIAKLGKKKDFLDELNIASEVKSMIYGYNLDMDEDFISPDKIIEYASSFSKKIPLGCGTECKRESNCCAPNQSRRATNSQFKVPLDDVSLLRLDEEAVDYMRKGQVIGSIDGNCMFYDFDTNGCGNYEDRPVYCMTFPVFPMVSKVHMGYGSYDYCGIEIVFEDCKGFTRWMKKDEVRSIKRDAARIFVSNPTLIANVKSSSDLDGPVIWEGPKRVKG